MQANTETTREKEIQATSKYEAVDTGPDSAVDLASVLAI